MDTLPKGCWVGPVVGDTSLFSLSADVSWSTGSSLLPYWWSNGIDHELVVEPTFCSNSCTYHPLITFIQRLYAVYRHCINPSKYSVYRPDGTVILHTVCHISQEGWLSSSIAIWQDSIWTSVWQRKPGCLPHAWGWEKTLFKGTLCHIFGQVEQVTCDILHLGNRGSWHTTWGVSSNHLQILKKHIKTAAIVRVWINLWFLCHILFTF